MWTYGPPEAPVLYENKGEAQTIALSVAEALQQEVGVYVSGERPMKVVSLIGFKEKGCPPELKPSSGSPGPTQAG